MKERPIIFSAAMVKAILEGRKTQTRRVIKPQPVPSFTNAVKCPYGQPGDRLWVRETCQAVELPSGLDGVQYLADGTFRPIENTPQAAELWCDLNSYGKAGATGRLVPSIHMPRWASRITLEITGVRVERVREISQRDAIDEGLKIWYRDGYPGMPYFGIELADVWEQDPRGTYARLWDSINGQRPGCAWADNPWVWVVEFRRGRP